MQRRNSYIAIVLRCVDLDEFAVHEYFLTFVEATSLDAESLMQYIVDTLKKHHLQLEHITSQGYDGASVMSGSCSGVQERLEVFAPNAIYIHCYAHVLNLVLGQCEGYTRSHSIFCSSGKSVCFSV